MTKRTTVELLEKYRKDLNLEKKKGKKKKTIKIDVRKISKKKKKSLKKMVNPKIKKYLVCQTKEQEDAFWLAYDDAKKFIDFEEMKERDNRIKENRKRAEKYIDEKIREMDLDSVEELEKFDKIVDKAGKNYYKRFKRFGYEIGEDDILYVNEEKLIKRLKQEKKEFKKINNNFLDYLERTMGSDSVYAANLERATRNLDKRTSELIKSLETVAMDSSIFKLR